MDVFEGLENLNVSEECFDEIISLIEAHMSVNNIRAVFNRAKDKENSAQLTKDALSASKSAALNKVFDGIKKGKIDPKDQEEASKRNEEYIQAVKDAEKASRNVTRVAKRIRNHYRLKRDSNPYATTGLAAFKNHLKYEKNMSNFPDVKQELVIPDDVEKYKIQQYRKRCSQKS